MQLKKLGFLAFFASLLALGGCNDDPAAPLPDPAIDFSLLDVNQNSALYDQPVSPRDYQGSISAWYFGHAT